MAVWISRRRFVQGVAAGGLLIAGPDPTGAGNVLPGFGDQHEIDLLVEAGFSPVEAIRLGSAVLTGPNVGNFHEIYQALIKQNGVIQRDTPEKLAEATRQLFEQPHALEGLNARAFGALAEMSGALAATVERLMPLLADATAEVDSSRKLERAS